MAGVQVTFGANIQNLVDGVAGVKSSIDSISESARHLAEAFGIGFSVDKLAQFVDGFANLGTQTERNSALLGESANKIGGYSLMAEAAGGNLEELVHSVERMGLALTRADAGSAQATAALSALGISAKEL